MKELSLKANILWNTVGSLLYQACQWLTTILVVTLSSSYANSGILAFAMATGNIYSSLATYNVRTYQVSDIQKRFSSHNYVAFRLVTVLLASIFCVGYTLIIAPNSDTVLAVILYLFFKADEAFANVLYGIDQIANRMDYVGISQGIRGIGSLAFFCIGLSFFNSLFVAIVAMFLFCLMVTLFFDVPHSRVLAGIVPKITKAQCFSLFAKCAPAVASLTLYGATAAIARQWFGICYGEDLLGIYAAIATPCVLVQALANYLYTPLLGSIATFWFLGKKSELSNVLKRVVFFGAGFFALCVVLAMVFGGSVLSAIYGSSIVEYTGILVPALFAAFSMACSCFITDVLISIRYLKAAVFLNAVAFIVCICFMNLFMQLWSMNGINIVLITSYSSASILGGIYLAYKLIDDSAHHEHE